MSRPLSSVIAQHDDARKKELDAYFQRTSVLDTIQSFMQRLISDYETKQRTVPLNPYPRLLAHMRMAEINAKEVVIAPKDVKLYVPQDVIVYEVTGSGILNTQHQCVGIQLTTTGISVWGSRILIESLPMSILWQHAISRVYEGFTLWLTETEVQDDGNRVQCMGALVGPHIITLGHSLTLKESLPCQMEFERHIVVHGDQMEKAMMIFARQLIKALHDTRGEKMLRLLGAQNIVLVVTSSTTTNVWSLEKINSNRTTFVNAVKTALVANATFLIEALVSQDSSGISRLIISFFFHFQFIATTEKTGKNVSKTGMVSRSFVDTSCVITGGIFFQGRAGHELISRIIQTKTVEQPSQQPVITFKPFVQPSRDPLARDESQEDHILKIVGSIVTVTRTVAEARFWLTQLLQSFTYRCVMILIAISTILTALQKIPLDTDEFTTMVLKRHISFCVESMRHLSADARIHASSSMLVGLESLLNELNGLERSQQQALDDAYVGQMEKAQELFYWISVTACRDFLLLVTLSSGQSQTSSDEALVDLRVDIAAAIDQRRYAPCIVAECVMAQYIIDSCLDVALESAVMNTVALSLPPNPLINMTQHLRGFGVRHLRSRHVFSSSLNNEVHVAMTVTQTPDGKIYIGHSTTPTLTLYTMNSQLLALLDPERITYTHEWLAKQQIYRTTQYHPSKASYSAQIFTSLLLQNPVIQFSHTSINKMKGLVDRLTMIEHVVIEGKDFGLAMGFFADAVRMDIDRFRTLIGINLTSMKMYLRGPRGEILTTVELEDMVTFEQLIVEATNKQCILEVQLTILHPTEQSIASVTVITKCYACHFESENISSVLFSMDDQRQKTLHPLQSDVFYISLYQFGVFLSEDSIRLAFKEFSHDKCKKGSIPERLYDDHLLRYEWEVALHPVMHPVMIDESLQMLFIMHTSIQWILEQLVTHETIPSYMITIIMHLVTGSEHYIKPLAENMGYLDWISIQLFLRTLQKDISSSVVPTRSVLPLLRRLEIMILLVRSMYQYDVFNNA